MTEAASRFVVVDFAAKLCRQRLLIVEPKERIMEIIFNWKSWSDIIRREMVIKSSALAKYQDCESAV
jgi:hypothetical protein